MTIGRRTVWVLAVLAVAVAVAPLVGYWLTNPADQRMVDLEVYRMGGSAVLLGLPLYEVITPAPQLLPFTYPPIAGLLAVPLTYLSWPAAQWLWTAALIAVLVVTVWQAFRPLTEGVRATWAGPLLLAALTVACAYLMPVRDQMRFGQVDLFLVALCLLDCTARRPWWPRGLLIGLATAVKLTPGVFLIYLAITGFPRRTGDPRQRHALGIAIVTAGLLTLLPFLVIPDDAWDFWFRALLDSDRVGANAATTNQSLRGMLLRLYLPDWLTSVIWLAAVAVVGGYGLRQARRAFHAGDNLAGVALTGLMAVLLSPVAWIHHLAWVVVVLAALVGDGGNRKRLLVAGGAWLYYVVPIPWWGVSIKALEIPVISPVIGKTVQNAFGLGAIVLVWVLGSWLPRQRAVDPASSTYSSAV